MITESLKQLGISYLLIKKDFLNEYKYYLRITMLKTKSINKIFVRILIKRNVKTS